MDGKFRLRALVIGHRLVQQPIADWVVTATRLGVGLGVLGFVWLVSVVSS